MCVITGNGKDNVIVDSLKKRLEDVMKMMLVVWSAQEKALRVVNNGNCSAELKFGNVINKK